MSGFFGGIMNMFSKKKGESPKTDLIFSISEESINEKLNQLVQQFQYKNQIIRTYDEYLKYIESIISKRQNIDELTFRYLTQVKKEKQNEKATTIEKMREIGKIGLTQTHLEKITGTGILSCDQRRYEEKKKFASIRGTNGVTSGKWCFEVQIITNGLFQFGWCQLTTAFTSSNGVGDDQTSYSYDGWRIVKFHKNQENYGDLWDVGDYIGCCIDLDNKVVEFFLNGKSLGIAYKDVLIGKNIAYFPGVSLRKKEQLRINFGTSKFKYEYPGYQSLDLSLGEISGDVEITKNLSSFLEINIIPLIEKDLVSAYEIILLSHSIFNYLSTISCLDETCLKESIIPLLHRTLMKSEKLFKYMIISMLSHQTTHEGKVNLVRTMMTYLSNIIEESSLLGEKEIEKWESLIQIFIALLSIDIFVDFWFETQVVEHLKNIFNSNFFRYPSFYEYLKTKYNNIHKSKIPIIKIVRELSKENNKKNGDKIFKLSSIYSKYFSHIIYIFLSNQKKYAKDKTLKDFFNILLNNSHTIISYDLFNMMIYEERKSQIVFLRNIYFNMLYMFNEKYITKPFEELTTSPFFIRTKPEDIYYGEVSIGGTITHVTETYLSSIDKKLIVSNNEFYTDYFHKLIRLSNSFPVKHLVCYLQDMGNSWKTDSISSVLNFKNGGANKAEGVLRDFFYLFTFDTEVTFYKFSYYLISYFTWLIEQNENMLYFIPFKIIELMFSYFILLIGLKSQILSNKELRAKLNQSSPFFSKDNYVDLFYNFYLKMFSDEKITNPEIRESLYKKVFFLLEKKQKIKRNNDNNTLLIEYLMKGILANMKNESYALLSCKILMKLVEQNCFSYQIMNGKSSLEKNNNIFSKYTQKYLSDNNDVLNGFLQNYSRLTNDIMTTFAISLSSFIEKLNNPYQPLTEDSKYRLYLNLSTSYYTMCNMLKLSEYFITINPELFLIVKSLNYSHFINIVKNLSLRIIAKPYISNLVTIIKLYDGKNVEGINEKRKIRIKELGYIIVGLFLQIQNMQTQKNYDTFLHTIANLSEIQYSSFLELSNEMKEKEKTETNIKYLSQFESYINTIISLKDKNTLSQEELDKLDNENKLCILCYENIANKRFVPCHHIGCEECINQYMAEKDICFICHEKIEGVEENKFDS